MTEMGGGRWCRLGVMFLGSPLLMVLLLLLRGPSKGALNVGVVRW